MWRQRRQSAMNGPERGHGVAEHSTEVVERLTAVSLRPEIDSVQVSKFGGQVVGVPVRSTGVTTLSAA